MPAPLGRHGFSMLLFQDMAAIPLLALAAVLGQAAPPSASPAAAASVAWWWQLGAVAAVVLLGRYVAYPRIHAGVWPVARHNPNFRQPLRDEKCGCCDAL